MRLIITADGVLARFSNQLGALGKKAPLAMQRALARTGDGARKQVVRALAQQTGLPQKRVIHRAVRIKRPHFGDLSYTMTTRGGDIRLKYFRARETRKGVAASPWGERKVFAGTFTRAGWVWKKRIIKSNWNGQVFRRSGEEQFEVVRSGVIIPAEMVKGATVQAWHAAVDRNLEQRLRHEIGRLLPG